MLAQYMVGDADDVFRALAQCRYRQPELRQAMIEVATKATGPHRLLQILIGRSHYANIHIDLAAASQAVVRDSVEDTQQFDLYLRIEVAYFIEEERTSVRQLKQPWLERFGPAEGALFIAKKLALHQVFRNGGAID